MKSQNLLALPLGGLALASALSLAPAGAEPNGRPPPIKLGDPSPSPTPQPPIKIGKPAPSGPLSGVGLNEMIDAALKQPLNPQRWDWVLGNQNKAVSPSGPNICLLTSVGGKFAGAGEHIVLDVDPNTAGGPRWTIGGTSGQNELRAAVTCARKDKFTPGFMDNQSIGYQSVTPHLHASCNAFAFGAGLSGQGNALFIREIAGKWSGGGEAVVASQNSAAGATVMNACSGNVVGGLAAIKFNGSGPVKWYSRGGRTTNVNAATFRSIMKWENSSEFWGSWGPADLTMGGDYRLIPVDKGLCGIVGIRGPFNGYGETIDILPKVIDGVNMWTLNISNAKQNSLLDVAVRCIARDQR